MSFVGFLNKTASVKRLTPMTDPDKSDYQTVGSFACNLQQSTAEEAILAGGAFGKVFKMYCQTGQNILESDRVAIGGIDYSVKGIKKLEMGTIPHLEIFLLDNLS